MGLREHWVKGQPGTDECGLRNSAGKEHAHCRPTAANPEGHRKSPFGQAIGQTPTSPILGAASCCGLEFMKHHRLLPQVFDSLREGYTARAFLADALAGLTVGIIALPLAMAFGIASIPERVAQELASQHAWLSPPAMGLYTAVIAGFLISAFGGSRVQIGGPTGAFIVIVYGIAERHGYAGLATATLMAGVIVTMMGVAGLGAMIKFIPYPVTTGFTTGIAVIIASSQLKDFFGLTVPGGVPGEFIEKMEVLGHHAASWRPATLAIGAGTLGMLILQRRFAPKLPGPIVAVIVATVVALLWKQADPTASIETIGERFGELPRTLPMPAAPAFSFDLIRKLVPEATTIALLCAIESLLSAVVADGMTGHRHKSDAELVGQGVANVASSFFWGLPATGAIARTVANVKTGARSPIAGMLHAAVLLLFMLALAPLAKTVPLSALAGVLLMVAWNMSELDHFRSLLRAPKSDVLVLLTTFFLTVLVDLTVAVGVGMVLASLLFMKRMSEVSNISAITGSEDDAAERAEGALRSRDSAALERSELPEGIEVYEINGPFFFGVADRLKDTLSVVAKRPKAFILRMRDVPAIDATGLHALEEFHEKCHRQGTVLILAGVHTQPLFALTKVGLDRKIGIENMTSTIEEALDRGREIAANARSRPSSATLAPS